MKPNTIERRDFIKLLALGGTALGAGLAVPTVVGTTDRGRLLRSQDEYGAFTVEQSRLAGFPYRVDAAAIAPMS